MSPQLLNSPSNVTATVRYFSTSTFLRLAASLCNSPSLSALPRDLQARLKSPESKYPTCVKISSCIRVYNDNTYKPAEPKYCWQLNYYSDNIQRKNHKPVSSHHLPTTVTAPSLRSYPHCLVVAKAHATNGWKETDKGNIIIHKSHIETVFILKCPFNLNSNTYSASSVVHSFRNHSSQSPSHTCISNTSYSETESRPLQKAATCSS